MDTKIGELRARIACRIYRKLFDAGSSGATIAYDEMLDSTLAAPRDHATVQHVLKRLCADGAIHQDEGSRPLHYVLLPDAASRMSNPLGADPISYAQHILLDLDAFDRGMEVPSGNWLDYEVRIRKGQLDREPL